MITWPIIWISAAGSSSPAQPFAAPVATAVYGTTSHHHPGTGFVQNPESALVPVPKPLPTLIPTTPATSSTANNVSRGGSAAQSVSSGYTVAPKTRKASEKVPDDNLIDLDGLGQSLDK